MKQTYYVILGLLSESSLTGYQIKKIIDTRFSFFWSESYGQIYPALKSLNELGMIEELSAEVKKNRSQREFKITDYGLEALKDWLHQPVEKETIRLGILLKLYFSDIVENEVILKHLYNFQQKHKEDLNTLKQFDTELSSIINEHSNHERVLQVINLGIKTNEAYLSWCNEAISYLKGVESNETEN